MQLALLMEKQWQGFEMKQQSCSGSSIVGSASVLSTGFEAESVSILSSLSSSWSLISFSSSMSDLEGQIIQE